MPGVLRPSMIPVLVTKHFAFRVSMTCPSGTETDTHDVWIVKSLHWNDALSPPTLGPRQIHMTFG